MGLYQLILLKTLFHNTQTPELVKVEHTHIPVSYNQYDKKTKASFGNIMLLKRNTKVTVAKTEYFADKKLKSTNFITNLMNRYWQERIYFSSLSPEYEHYTRQLKIKGIATKSNEYKHFLYNFNKALISGKIKVYPTANSQKSLLESHVNFNLRYVWRKSLNGFSFRNVHNSIIKNTKINSLSTTDSNFVKQLQVNRLPVFIVANNLNQIIMAEPSNALIINRHLVSKIYQWYNDSFRGNIDQQNVYHGLLFVNPYDALEYKNHIKQKYGHYDLNHKLKVSTTGLDLYYRLINQSLSRAQFHLIPDFKELERLINHYQYLKNVSFHKKQKHAKRLFQGQPIYIINLAKMINKKNSDNYMYISDQANEYKDHTVAFLNYDIALKYWQQLRKKTLINNLPNEPKVLVYNLESFLADTQKNNEKFVLVPPYESYKFIMLGNSNKYQSPTEIILTSAALHCKITVQRFIWAITSKLPVK